MSCALQMEPRRVILYALFVVASYCFFQMSVEQFASMWLKTSKEWGLGDWTSNTRCVLGSIYACCPLVFGSFRTNVDTRSKQGLKVKRTFWSPWKEVEKLPATLFTPTNWRRYGNQTRVRPFVPHTKCKGAHSQATLRQRLQNLYEGGLILWASTIAIIHFKHKILMISIASLTLARGDGNDHEVNTWRDLMGFQTSLHKITSLNDKNTQWRAMAGLHSRLLHLKDNLIDPV